MRFWDTSALVPLVLEEAATPVVRSLAQQDPELVIWWGTAVEWTSALERLSRDGLSGEAHERASAAFRQIRDHAIEVQPIESVRSRAMRLLRLHALRGADALQLAAALYWCRERTHEAAFVSLDERLRTAARDEGFEILPYPSDLPEIP